MGIFYCEKVFHAGKKSGKMTLPPLKKYSSYASADEHYIAITCVLVCTLTSNTQILVSDFAIKPTLIKHRIWRGCFNIQSDACIMVHTLLFVTNTHPLINVPSTFSTTKELFFHKICSTFSPKNNFFFPNII